MDIEDIVRMWKADEDDDEENTENQGGKAPQNPAGEELSDEELQQAAGGLGCEGGGDTCDGRSCVWFSCILSNC